MKKLYKIIGFAERLNIKMVMSFYVQAKSIQAAVGKSQNYLKKYESKHKIRIIKIEEYNKKN